MQAKQSGFTLIELVVVIIILGILAATALPRFINLSNEARNAAVQGVAAAATSGYAINYGARRASNVNAVPVASLATAICTNSSTAPAIGSVMTGGLPTGYNVAVGSGTSCVPAASDGTTGTCILTDATLATASATITYICANP